jgi:hypothetical protein
MTGSAVLLYVGFIMTKLYMPNVNNDLDISKNRVVNLASK